MLPTISFADLEITIFDTETDEALLTVSQGDEIPLELLEERSLTFAVEFSDPALAASVNSVRLSFGDQVRVEGVSPYALFGDIGAGDFLGGTGLATGEFALKIEVFGEEDGQTVTMLDETLNFEVVETVDEPEPVTPSTDLVIEVIDTATDEVLATIEQGDELPAELLDGRDVTFSVYAADPDFEEEIGSIRMTLGDIVKVENITPYALFGNTGDDYKGGDSFGQGGYSLQLEVFSERGATGETLLTTTTAFSIAASVDPAPPAADGVYQGEGGTVVMEAENGDRSGVWAETSFDGQTAMIWDAASNSYGSVPEGEQLSFEFQTDESGTYYIGLHSARDKSAMSESDLFTNGVARTDTGNDAYVRVTNLDTGEVILEPIKLFTNLGGTDQEFRWGQTFDAHSSKSDAAVELEAGTNYQLDIIGRSDGYVLDKITLNNGSVLTDENAEESARGDTTVAEPPSEVAENSVGTDNEFAGIRLWVANDISEIDDAASTPSLILGARNIASSDDNATGSADLMTFEGAYVDTVRTLATNWVDEVEAGVNAAGERYGVDVYSPRTDIDIGADEAALTAAMTQSLETAYANNEQVIVISGGPSEFSGQVLVTWLNEGSTAEKALKAVWALQGGFSQVTHGATYQDNDVLDYSRDPSNNFFNISNNGDSDYIKTTFEAIYQQAISLAQAGVGSAFTAAEYSALEQEFIPTSFLISVENQNSNIAVRGPAEDVAETILDDLALEYAATYDKGSEIDISDVGMLGILLGDGSEPLDAADMTKFLTNDFDMV